MLQTFIGNAIGLSKTHAILQIITVYHAGEKGFQLEAGGNLARLGMAIHTRSPFFIHHVADD
jgi:hypothetical protein